MRRVLVAARERRRVVPTFPGEALAVSRPLAPAQALARVAELDGIRGIAILLVLAHHFGTPACPRGILNDILAFGWVGVDLFFVLSGFLITGILLDSKDKPDYFRRFYLRRVFRIFPVYYAYLILVFHILPLTARLTGRLSSFEYDLSGEGWYWAYLSNWRSIFHQNVHLTHFWSLSIEEQFYIVWPLVLYLVPTRALKYVCVSLAVLSPILRLVAGHAGVSIYFLYRTTPFRLEGLALGALLALATRDVMLHKRITKLIRWWPTGAAVLAGVVIWSGPSNFNSTMEIYGYPVIAVLCWALVSWGVIQAGGQGWFARLLRTSWLVRFGKYSYGLYVWHWLIAVVVRGWVLTARDQSGLSWSLLPVALGVGIGVTYGVALLSWKLIEEPCARLKERVAG